MAKNTQYRRLFLLTMLLGVAFAGLGYRLVDLQVLRHEDLQTEARRNTQRGYQLEPRRGEILDIKGNLLATSLLVKTVCADPTLVGDRQAEVAHALAPLLQLSESELSQRLMPQVVKNEQGQLVPRHYVVLKRKVPAELWQKIADTMADLPLSGSERDSTNRAAKAFYRDLRAKAIYADPVDEQLRSYPAQTLAAHVLGFTGITTHTNNGRIVQDMAGVDGIERMLNAKLAGVRGWRLTEVDKYHQELVSHREEDVEPHDGLSVVLTIDSFLQTVLENSLAEAMKRETPISASGIILRPSTGEILAMAVLPNFDPNNPGGSEDARRNRIISDVHEPGSTFKIIVISGALDDGTVTLNDTFDCEHGRFAFAGHTLHDHAAYGTLTTEGIITKSSNIGAAKVGIKMGEARLYQHMVDYGIGVRTGIPLPGEVPGLLHSVKNWSKVSIAQIPMGQGVATTSLQMAMAMAAIANKGVLMQPMLVDRLQERNGTVIARYAPQAVRRVISENTSKQMIEALKTVATPDGTAPKAALDHYTVAGKTGTAQKPPYTSNKFYASFIGFFPADNPEVCIYLSLDEPKGNLHQGGQVCAPMFKEIAEKAANYLNIRPDRDGEQGIPEVVITPGADQPVKAVAARAPG